VSNQQKQAGGSRGHHKLEAWKKARELVVSVYRLSQAFPKEEMFGLTAQMRRAAVSIPSNIAEGAARTGDREFAQFLSIAKGSLSELETQLLIATDLGYMKSNDPAFELLELVARLLTGLHKSVRR
jgi:four helix bundle protein